MRSLIVIAVGWMPLLLLSCLQSLALHLAGIAAFAADFGAHARFLVAAPVLVLAEVICAPRLGAIGRHFRTAGLVPEHEQPRFDAAVRSTGELLNSVVAPIVIALMAYAMVFGLFQSVSFHAGLPAWHRSNAAWAFRYSPAGWWHMLVSLPLLLTLLLGWLWRLALWMRFLWLMARLDLCLIPSHPDRAAGLQFVGRSLRAFAIVAFALGTIAAGRVANAVAHEGASLDDYTLPIAGLLIVVVLAFMGPLMVFVGVLLQQIWRGVFEYGALAHRMGWQFERKWVNRDDQPTEDALAAPDFSAEIDLYSIVSNVYAMRPVPIDLQSFVLLACAVLLPFLPVVLMSVPVSTVLDAAKHLLR